MKDSSVEGFNDCCSAGRHRVSLFLGFDDWIGSAGEFRFEFHSVIVLLILICKN